MHTGAEHGLSSYLCEQHANYVNGSLFAWRRLLLCAQHGERLRLRGKGVYNAQRGTKGDQWVLINVMLPKSLTSKQVRLMSSCYRHTVAEQRGDALRSERKRNLWTCAYDALLVPVVCLQKELLQQFMKEEEQKKKGFSA